jgi:hypothetical protein
MDEFARTIDVMGEAIARRAGRSGRDMNARVLVGAVIGVIMSVAMPWSEFAVGEGDVRNLFGRIDEGLALLESGLPL